MKTLFLMIFVCLFSQTLCISAQPGISSQPTSFQANAPGVEAYLDGIITSLMDQHHLTAASLALVQNGEVFIQKGYGHQNLDTKSAIDPITGLFRIGSVTKLFTWIAVLQQIEKGTLELDRDVNDYLETFKVPATYDQPITLRSLMSHTPGFEDVLPGLFLSEDNEKPGTVEYLKKRLPARIRPPLQTASYSNQGTALAQYLIEITSGMAFEDYAEQYIFNPLGMQYTTLRQPLPAHMRADYTTAYAYREGKFIEKGFEIVPVTGMGGATTTAGDMAIFMKALLNNTCGNGHCLLDSSSFALMQTPVLRHAPGINAALHGFMDLSRRGVSAFGHGGNTFLYHTNLMIIPDHNLGMFVTFSGEAGGMAPTRTAEAFLDRFFPDTMALKETIVLDEDYLNKFTGTYKMNRHSHNDIFKLLALFMTTSVTLENGKLKITNEMQDPIYCLPIDSLTFRDENSNDLVAFKRDGENISHLFVGNYAIFAFERVTGFYKSIPNLLIFLMTMFSMVFILVIWPLIYLIRRQYKPLQDTKRSLPLKSKLLALAPACFYLLFFLLIMPAMAAGQELVMNIPASMKIAMFFPLAAIPFILLMLWQLLSLWKNPGIKVRSRLFYTFACVSFALFTWQLYFWNLLGWNF